MKKIVKFLSLLLVLLLCCSMCGCDYLESLRATRAAYTETGNIRLQDGTEYARLPECKELQPSFTKYDCIWVVEEDIPLLLIETYGDCYQVSDDGKFLRQDYSRYSDVYYCRTDIYSQVLVQIQNGFRAERYGFWYYDETTYDYTFYVLTQEQCDAVDHIYATITPELLPEAASLKYDAKISLCSCTEDGMFMREWLDVCLYKDKYYIVGHIGDSMALYQVPVGFYANIFAELFIKVL